MTDRLMTYEYDEGFDAYRTGQPLEDCPYPAGTRDARDWKQGWHNARHDDWCDAMEAHYGHAA